MLTRRVLPFLMALAGRTVLRAAAVEVAGGAVAVTGPPGVGTSTLTAWLCATGAPLVTDDVLRVDPDGTCHRGALEIRLRDRAQPVATGLVPSGRGVRRTLDGRRAVRPPATSSERLRLRAVVVPRPVPGSHELAMHRAEAATAAMALAEVPHTLGWRISDPVQALLTTVTTVATHVGVHIVDIPWGPPFDPDIPARLLDLLGLGPPAHVPCRGHTSSAGTAHAPHPPPATVGEARTRSTAAARVTAIGD